MLDYQRTTTRETNAVTPSVDPHSADAPAPTVSRSETTYKASGPGGATLASRIVMFVFGILQALLILRIILLLLVANQGNDVAALVALIGWTLVEALILAGIRIFSRRPSETV